jgi:hypothetical protein
MNCFCCNACPAVFPSFRIIILIVFFFFSQRLYKTFEITTQLFKMDFLFLFGVLAYLSGIGFFSSTFILIVPNDATNINGCWNPSGEICPHLIPVNVRILAYDQLVQKALADPLNGEVAGLLKLGGESLECSIKDRYQINLRTRALFEYNQLVYPENREVQMYYDSKLEVCKPTSEVTRLNIMECIVSRVQIVSFVLLIIGILGIAHFKWCEYWKAKHARQSNNRSGVSKSENLRLRIL